MSSTRRLHLMIVDDDASVRETLAMVLSKANYVTSTARDGVDALAQFRTRVPDLLLTDLEMTRISGVDFLCSVRLSFPEVAVVAMSCTSDEEHLRMGSSPMRFIPKGRSHPEKLFRIIMDGIRTCEARVSESIIHQASTDAAWLQRSNRNALRHGEMHAMPEDFSGTSGRRECGGDTVHFLPDRNPICGGCRCVPPRC